MPDCDYLTALRSLPISSLAWFFAKRKKEDTREMRVSICVKTPGCSVNSKNNELIHGVVLAQPY